MSKAKDDQGKYRRGVGVMLLNGQGKVFVGARIDNTDEAWQMPQGGIDKGEEPWATALRELEEETGIPPHLVERIADCPERLKYDLPEELRGKLWGGKWIGQDQDWYLGRFLGRDSDVNIATKHPGIPRVEVDRARSASRADRAVQARPLPASATRVCRLPLRRGEIADAATDYGTEDRADEWQRDCDDGADGGGNCGPLHDWVFEHPIFSFRCVIQITQRGV